MAINTPIDHTTYRAIQSKAILLLVCTMGNGLARPASPKNKVHVEKNASCQVFLGGSCNPTTWRKDVAIPFLERNRITYYNPQVDDWHEGLVAIEKYKKDTAHVLLFVIDDITRGYASIAEAAYYVGKGRRVVLVIQTVQGPGDVITAPEVKDINRGRTYLKDIANAEKVKVFGDLVSALNHIVIDMI